MSKNKTVVLLVEHIELNAHGNGNDLVKQVVESIEVGKDEKYKNPTEFITDFARIYRDINRGNSSRFIIKNVIIN